MDTQLIKRDATRRLLKKLDTVILYESDGLTTVQVGFHHPLVIVTVETKRLRAWCLRRLETRAGHVGRAIRGTGGGHTRTGVSGELIG